MGVETSYGQSLCQYALHSNKRFRTAVLGNIKAELLIKLAEQSLPSAVLHWLGEDGLSTN